MGLVGLVEGSSHGGYLGERRRCCGATVTQHNMEGDFGAAMAVGKLWRLGTKWWWLLAA